MFCLKTAYKSSKLYTVLRVIIKLLLPILALLASYVTANITNALAGQMSDGCSANVFLFLMIILASIKIASMILNKINVYIIQNHNELLDKDINLNIMSICMNSDIEMFDNPQYYDQLQLARRDSQTVIAILWSVLDFISAVLSFISVLVILQSRENLLALIITASSFPAAIISHHFTKKNYELSVEQTNEEREKSYYTGIASEKRYSQIIRINNMGDWIKHKYHDIWQKLFLQRKALHKKNYIFDTIVKAIPEIVIVCALINIGIKVIDGEYLIGDYALYTGLFAQLYTQITLTIENAMSIYDNKMRIENLLAFNDAPHRIVSGEAPLESIETIEFRDVCFRYPFSDVDILKSVKFLLKKGEKVALVGLNGCGKSTVLKLIMRFYDPTGGQILINGLDIKRYRLDDLRACIDCYFQNSVNLPFSIRKNVNIRDGDQCNIHDSAIVTALEQAFAKDVLRQSQGNLSTHISRLFSDIGVELSEGQHQKVAIARVFYSNKQFAIFDEPSSSLDPKAEDEIFQSIRDSFKDKTVLFTSHRLTNLFLADRILVLEGGKIIENGSRDELLNKKERFYDRYQYQASKFANGEST